MMKQLFFHPGHEKFAEIFLGEFDTPEAIWNSEMRYRDIALAKRT